MPRSDSLSGGEAERLIAEDQEQLAEVRNHEGVADQELCEGVGRRGVLPDCPDGWQPRRLAKVTPSLVPATARWPAPGRLVAPA